MSIEDLMQRLRRLGVPTAELEQLVERHAQVTADLHNAGQKIIGLDRALAAAGRADHLRSRIELSMTWGRRLSDKLDEARELASDCQGGHKRCDVDRCMGWDDW